MGSGGGLPVHLVEEVLHQLGDADVVEVSVHQQHLLQVLELWDGVVAVPGRLATLLTHDALGGKPERNRQKKKKRVRDFRWRPYGS